MSLCSLFVRLFGTASLFGCACLGLRPCLAALVWDYVPVWLRLFGTASLFGCVCLGLRPCLAARSNPQTKPKAQTSKQARRAQTKQLCCSNKTQRVQTIKEKSLKSGDFSLFSCIFAKKAVPLQPQRFLIECNLA